MGEEQNFKLIGVQNSISNEEKKDDQIAKTALIFAGIGLGCVLAVFSIFWWNGFIFDFSKNFNPQISSNLGDLVGGLVGPILSFAAILLIWVTYRTQKRELNETQEVLKKQERVQNRQQFETTYFSLLQTQRVLKKSMSFKTKDRIMVLSNGKNKNELVKGEEFFHVIKKDLYDLYTYVYKYNSLEQMVLKINDEYAEREESTLLEEVIPTEEVPEEERIKFVYKFFFETYHPYIGHYFRFTYHILNFIYKEQEKEISLYGYQSNEKEIREKFKTYADILQAQMSSSELFMMFYNGACFKNAFKLINEFHFLDNLTEEDIILYERQKDIYDFKLKSRYELV